MVFMTNEIAQVLLSKRTHTRSQA